MSGQHLSWGHLSISAISQLLLVRFGSNFKQRVLGTYTTDYKCHPRHLSGQHLSWGHLSISAISHLLLARFGSNFEHRALGTYTTHTTVTTTFAQATFVLGTFVHIQKFQLLLARFGSNFKQWVLGTYTTDYNCHHDICPSNICPGDICPYQQYLSCYWPYLDQTLNKGSWE